MLFGEKNTGSVRLRKLSWSHMAIKWRSWEKSQDVISLLQRLLLTTPATICTYISSPLRVNISCLCFSRSKYTQAQCSNFTSIFLDLCVSSLRKKGYHILLRLHCLVLVCNELMKKLVMFTLSVLFAQLNAWLFNRLLVLSIRGSELPESTYLMPGQQLQGCLEKEVFAMEMGVFSKKDVSGGWRGNAQKRQKTEWSHTAGSAWCLLWKAMIFESPLGSV